MSRPWLPGHGTQWSRACVWWTPVRFVLSFEIPIDTGMHVQHTERAFWPCVLDYWLAGSRWTVCDATMDKYCEWHLSIIQLPPSFYQFIWYSVIAMVLAAYLLSVHVLILVLNCVCSCMYSLMCFSVSRDHGCSRVLT